MKKANGVTAIIAFSFLTLVSCARTNTTACEILPLGLPAPKENAFSIKEDIEIGAREFRTAINIGVFRDPKIEKYFLQLLEKLFPHIPAYAKGFPYSFFVHQSEEPNASTRSGGIIIVTLGKLREAPSDDYLAFMLAHEVGHIALRHETRMKTLQKLSEFETIFLARVASSWPTSPHLTRKEKKLLTALQTDVQSRLDNLNRVAAEHEFEADRFAAWVGARAGFNPASTIARYQQQAQMEKRGWSDWATHPHSFFRALTLKCETLKDVHSETISPELHEVKKITENILSRIPSHE